MSARFLFRIACNKKKR